jgi:FkbM family methyltransferase
MDAANQILSIPNRLKVFYQQYLWKPIIALKAGTVWHGNPKAGFYICPHLLPEQPLVYSFGVGDDISFDLAIIEKYNGRVEAFDPTPASVTFIDQLQLSLSRFQHHPFGLQKVNGNQTFYFPRDPNFSGTVYQRWKKGTKDVEVLSLPFKNFGTILAELKPQRIDVLKMDIEGSEYDVLDDILSSSVPVTQILIEFHHRFPGRSLKDTKGAIEKLKTKGYLLAAASPKNEEFTFVKTSAQVERYPL